jgi:hypothetical protein
MFDKVEKEFPDCPEVTANSTTSVGKMILKVIRERKDYQLPSFISNSEKDVNDRPLRGKRSRAIQIFQN